MRAALADSISALADVPIAHWTLGRHDESDFHSADAIVVNPAVRPDHPLVQLARSGGAEITSEIELFLERCPGRVIGVTGSNGKSSTATMLFAMFRAAGRPAWLGGNIGNSLLPSLGEIRPGDVVVLELSSFQLAHLSDRTRFPAAAVVTGCTPNHLDWHGTFAAYAAAKRRLVEQLPAGGWAVLNPADRQLALWCVPLHAKRLAAWPLESVPEMSVAGDHQRTNASLAAALAEALDVERGAISAALAGFRPLAHRQQPAGSLAGRQFIDDSKSTTPEATLAALAACPGPAWVLVGGQDKQVSLGDALPPPGRASRGHRLLWHDRAGTRAGIGRGRLPASIRGGRAIGRSARLVLAAVVARRHDSALPRRGQHGPVRRFRPAGRGVSGLDRQAQAGPTAPASPPGQSLP